MALFNLEGMAPLSRTLSLPGPSTLTYAYLLDLISTVTHNPPSRAPTVPKSIALALSRLSQRTMFWPTLSPDEIERRYIDDFGSDQDVEVPGDWDAVGVVPDEIERHTITYVRRYRSAWVYFHSHKTRGSHILFDAGSTTQGLLCYRRDK
jgi:NADH dehydrogenase (ubiquinone) 1 alpha subcomplex subunit 9